MADARRQGLIFKIGLGFSERRTPPVPEPWFSFLSDKDETQTEDGELQCLGGFLVTV